MTPVGKGRCLAATAVVAAAEAAVVVTAAVPLSIFVVAVLVVMARETGDMIVATQGRPSLSHPRRHGAC